MSNLAIVEPNGHPGIAARNNVVMAVMGVMSGELDMGFLDAALRDYVQTANTNPVYGTVYIPG